MPENSAPESRNRCRKLTSRDLGTHQIIQRLDFGIFTQMRVYPPSIAH